MKLRFFILISLVGCLNLVVSGQASKTVTQDRPDQRLASERSELISDLRNLDEQATNLSSLSRAAVKAEIADAAWFLDREWAKKLLTKAYELTLPGEDEQEKLRLKVMGSQPSLPQASDRARRRVRNRIVKIATRENGFADRLIRSGVDQMGKSEAQMAYATLAENARQDNDLASATKYLLESIDADPSQIAAG